MQRWIADECEQRIQRRRPQPAKHRDHGGPRSLLVTLFDRNNIPVEKLGDSGGILSEI